MGDNFFTDGKISFYTTEIKQYIQKYFPFGLNLIKSFESILSDLAYVLTGLKIQDFSIEFPEQTISLPKRSKEKNTSTLYKTYNPFISNRIHLFNIQQINNLINFKYEIQIRSEFFKFLEFFINLFFAKIEDEDICINYFMNKIIITIDSLIGKSNFPFNFRSELESKIRKDIGNFVDQYNDFIKVFLTTDLFYPHFDSSFLQDHKILKIWDLYYFKFVHSAIHFSEIKDIPNQFLIEILPASRDAYTSPFSLLSLSRSNMEDLYKNLLFMRKEIEQKKLPYFCQVIKGHFGLPILFKDIKNVFQKIPAIDELTLKKGNQSFFAIPSFYTDLSENERISLDSYLGIFYSPFTIGAIYLDDRNQIPSKYVNKQGKTPRAILRVQLYSVFEMTLNPEEEHGTTFYFNEEKPIWDKISQDIKDFASFYFRLFKRIFSYYPTHPLLLASDPTILYYLVNGNLFEFLLDFVYFVRIKEQQGLLLRDLKKSKQLGDILHHLNLTHNAKYQSNMNKLDKNYTDIDNIVRDFSFTILTRIGFQFILFNEQDFFPIFLNRKEFFKKRQDKKLLDEDFLTKNLFDIQKLIHKIFLNNRTRPLILFTIELCLYCLKENNKQKKIEIQIKFLNDLYSPNLLPDQFAIYYPYEINTFKKDSYLLRFKTALFLYKYDFELHIWKLDFVPFSKMELQLILAEFPYIQPNDSKAFTNPIEHIIIPYLNLKEFNTIENLEKISSICTECSQDIRRAMQGFIPFFSE